MPIELEGTLPWSWAQARLVANRNYWVVTVGADGHPHATPVWGVWDPDRDTFHFSCAPSSLKARNLAGNPHVVVAVDDTVEVVSVEGSARRVEGAARAAERFAEKYEPDPAARSAMSEFMLSHAVFEVTPVRAIGIIEREDDFSRRATRWVF